MSASWLERLEEKIEVAAREIERLREENRALSGRVAELEGDGSGAAGWAEERKDVRRRVEQLAQRLEGLLKEDE